MPMPMQFTAPRASLTLITVAALVGCASPPPRPYGAVVPMEGGRYQSSVKGPDTAQAMKTFTHDAEVTCFKGERKQRMPWEAAPPPPKYVVVSQTTKSKDGKEIKSDNKLLDAGIAVGLRHAGLEAQDLIEISTVFKCE